MTAISTKATMITVLVLLLAVLASPLALVNAAATVTVSVDKTSYSAGQVLKVSGTASPVTTGYDVAIIVGGPTGEQRAVDQVTPNPDGTYSKNVVTFAAGNPSGTWTVTATYQGASAVTTFNFVGTPVRTSIVVNVEVRTGLVFNAGDTVDAYILTGYSGKPLDANVTASWVYKTNQPALILQVSKVFTGLYRASLTLPANATAGTYTVVANASVLTSQNIGSGIGLGSFQVNPSPTLSDISKSLQTLQTGVNDAKSGIAALQKNFPVTVDLSLIWIAIALSLIACIAAVVSTITVQRKIAS
jgi:hypothetical protein